MQVKQRLKINVVVSVITAVILLLVLSVAIYRVNRALEASDIADDIVAGVFERNAFREDYLRSNSERAKIQWFAKYEYIGGLLKAAPEKFPDAEDRRTIDELIEDHQATGKIFSAIVENRGKSGLDTGPAALSQEIEDRLRTQMNMRLYDKILNIRKLHESARGNLFTALRLAGWSIFAAFVIILAVTIINSWTMRRIITDRVLRLRDGASVIGGGNLDHRIDVKGDDEFVELSDSFNAMTAKLSGSYNELRNEIEERKRTEEALRTSEQRYHSLFENMVEGCAYCKMLFDDRGRPADFVYLDVNSAFGRLTGLENVLGKKVTEAIPGIKESHPELFELYSRVALTGSPEKLEIEFTPLNIWLSLSVYSVEKGYFVVVFDNITARKQAEQRLHESEALFRAIGELNPFGVWECGPDGGVVYLSQSWLDVMGMTLEQCRHFGWMERYFPREGEKMLAAWQRCRETGSLWEYEHHMRDKNGDERWVLNRGFSMLDAHGQITKWVGLNIDITERKKAEEALRRAYDDLELRIQERTKELAESNASIKIERQRFYDVLDMLPVYVVLLTPDYQVPFANRFFRERFGEACGKRCFEYLFERTEPCTICETYNVLKTNAPHHWEWTGPDGYDYDIFDFPFTDPDGSPLIMEVGIDITGRKQAELVLRKLSETLEQRVTERTAELQAANAFLLNSRRATLNIMEDALAVRKRADEVSAELRQENTERKKVEELLRESEERVRLKLESILLPEGDIGDLELRDIIDAPAIQSLVNNLYKFVHLPVGILDLKGRVLVGVGWQDICTKFHRAHPDTCRHCAESDLELTKEVPAGEFRLYKCKNGMWDAVTPILVGGRHIGNLFWGQFFFEDEPLDREFFRAQALKYGFNEEEYLAALERVPRISRESLDTGMAFYLKFSDMLSKLSYSNIKLARALSERDTLLHSLRESEEGLKRAQKIAHLGSWDLDLVNNSLSWSDEVYRIFGLQPQEFGATYEAFLEAVHPDDRAAVDGAYSGSLREGRDTYEIEHRVVRAATGEVRYVHERCQHYRDEAGRIIRSVGMVHDITERKQAEADVLQLSEDMAARNMELESVNKELEAFIYSVSHDLRAPIRSMSGFAKIIVTDYADKLDEQGQDYLNRILKSSAKATRLIDDLLYLSKISRHEIARTKVDMSKNALSMVAELRESAPERGVEIDIKEGMTAFVDPRLVEIVITNLFENAWKFTSRTDEARIEFGASEQDGRTVYYIKDNGVGFDPNYADKMFLPFHRLHSDSEFEGTGIGLAIVERIIHRHGGRIWAEGEAGKGATVYFTFGRG